VNWDSSVYSYWLVTHWTAGSSTPC